MFEKEYQRHGIEFLKLADIVTDISQYSNIEILGTKYLKYQENYILESLAHNLEGCAYEHTDKKPKFKEDKSKFLYNFKDLKCKCDSKKSPKEQPDTTKSVADAFI